MTCAPVRESNLASVRKKYNELNDREAIFELSKNEDFNHYAELLQLYSEPKSIPELEPMYNVPIDTITDFQETGKNGNCKKKCFCNHFIFQQVTLFSCLFLHSMEKKSTKVDVSPISCKKAPFYTRNGHL